MENKLQIIDRLDTKLKDSTMSNTKHCHVCGGTDEWEDCSEYKDEGYVFCHRCGCDTVLVDKDFNFWDSREEINNDN